MVRLFVMDAVTERGSLRVCFFLRMTKLFKKETLFCNMSGSEGAKDFRQTTLRPSESQQS